MKLFSKALLTAILFVTGIANAANEDSYINCAIDFNKVYSADPEGYPFVRYLIYESGPVLEYVSGPIGSSNPVHLELNSDEVKASGNTISIKSIQSQNDSIAGTITTDERTQCGGSGLHQSENCATGKFTVNGTALVTLQCIVYLGNK